MSHQRGPRLRFRAAVLSVCACGLVTTGVFVIGNRLASASARNKTSRVTSNHIRLPVIMTHGRLLTSVHSGAQRRAGKRSGIAPSLVAHFSVFRRARSAVKSEALPAGPPASLSAMPWGLDVANARFVQIGDPVGANGVWVVPGSRGLCIIDPTNGGTCGGLSGPASPDSGGFRVTSSTETAETVTGLAPDGNSTVSVALADGNTMTVPVVNNIYSVTLNGSTATAVTVRDASGNATTFPLTAS